MVSRHPGHWSCTLNWTVWPISMITRVIIRRGERLVIALPITYVLVVRYCSGTVIGRCIESAYGAFPLKCSIAAAFVRVCGGGEFAITGWVVNKNNNYNCAETARIKLNAQTSCDIEICLNLCRLQCICWDGVAIATTLQPVKHRWPCIC